MQLAQIPGQHDAAFSCHGDVLAAALLLAADADFRIGIRLQ